MNETMRRDLGNTLRDWLTTELNEADRAVFNTWIVAQRSGDPSPFLPASKAMEAIEVAIFGETLLVAFIWPPSPSQVYVYAEELEDLSELGAESWAGILIAHLDETILPGFEDRSDLVEVGSLAFLVQDWS